LQPLGGGDRPPHRRGQSRLSLARGPPEGGERPRPVPPLHRVLLGPVSRGRRAARGLAAHALREGARIASAVPRLLAVGHVTWDRLEGGDVPGGAVTYAALTARRLGWQAAVLTTAGPDFDPARNLPDVVVFASISPATTRFTNLYEPDGTRLQVLSARAGAVDLAVLPDSWRDPD